MRMRAGLGHIVGIVEIGNGRWEMASRASRMSSAQRVRSALFFSVSGGTGKVFQPSVLE